MLSMDTPARMGSSRQDAILVVDECPNLPRGAQGKLAWKEGETAKNAAGTVSIAKAALNIVRHLVSAGGMLDEQAVVPVQEAVEFISEDEMGMRLFHLPSGLHHMDVFGIPSRLKSNKWTLLPRNNNDNNCFPGPDFH
ncbi:hypothetical protein V8C35DRAFT_139578 [Trichoderma chlorosporum]